MMGSADKVYHYIKLLLYTAEQEKADVTPTKLQKIFFLLKMEKGVDLGLDFKPWFFGVYSSLLQDYIDALIELGEVNVEQEEVRDPLSDEVIAYRTRYRLNTEFKPRKEDKDVEEFFRHWVRKNRDEILRYVYTKYPEWNKYELRKRT